MLDKYQLSQAIEKEHNVFLNLIFKKSFWINIVEYFRRMTNFDKKKISFFDGNLILHTIIAHSLHLFKGKGSERKFKTFSGTQMYIKLTYYNTHFT